jgi:PAS domain S-box-containing protein
MRLTSQGSDPVVPALPAAGTAESSVDAVLALDASGAIVGASHGALGQLGVESSALVGRSVWDVAVPARRRDRIRLRRPGAGPLAGLVGRDVDVQVRHGDGTTVDAQVRLAATPDSADGQYAATLRGHSIGANRSVDAQESPPVPAEAPEAPLTPAPERSPEDRLREALSGARRGSAVAILRVRVIDLPLVTSALGRQIGDELLAQVTARTEESLPEVAAVLPVVGGDTCLILTGLADDGASDALTAANRVLEHLTTTTDVQGEELRMHPAIGIALAPRHGDDPDVLLALAAGAARPADEMDCAGARLSAGTDADLRTHLRMRARLEGVSERDELQLLYQPIYELDRGVPYGVEALLRWEDPRHGAIPPNDFIPIAEQTGAIFGLGMWVVEELCRRAVEWRRQGIAPQLHFNASALELRRRDYASRLLSTIRGYSLPLSSFTIEVTESAVVLESDSVIPTLRMLRMEGMHVAIDDFGAGPSSLSRLRELPADMLKIDRALVSGLPGGRASKALLAAALQIAEALQMRAVAEGIETDAQRQYLAEAGCPLGQGFVLGRPAAGGMVRLDASPGKAAVRAGGGHRQWEPLHVDS